MFEPEHTGLGAADAVPPTDNGLTVTVTVAQEVLLQVPSALT